VVVGETDWLPLVVLAPLQPLLAVHEVALVLLQVSVEDDPLDILVGEAEILTVGRLLLELPKATAPTPPCGPPLPSQPAAKLKPLAT
jgi:hypothetical protein